MASPVLTVARPAPPSRPLVALRCDALRAWLSVYAGLCGFTLTTTLLVAILPGGAALARGVLHLTLTATHNPSPNLAGVLSIAANNTLHSFWPLSLGLLDAHRSRAARALADAFVTSNLAIPALLVGTALAAYGTRALPYLPHVPFEFAGIAVGTAGWLVERHRPLTPSERILCAGAAVLLLLVAAAIETYLVPHR